MTVLLRTEADPQSILGAVRERVQALDPNLPIYNIKPFRQYVSDSVAQPRFNSLLFCSFAGLALLLTAIGLYGVVAYSVSRRTKEIGVHLALGARAVDILRLVLGQGMKLILAGIVLGVTGSLLLTRWMQSML